MPETPEPTGNANWPDAIVIRCRLGRHRRITMGATRSSDIARCSCGGAELDRRGLWIETNQVGRRSVAECEAVAARNQRIAEMFGLAPDESGLHGQSPPTGENDHGRD